MSTLTFITGKPLGNESQKARELRDAVAKAHAARVSHRKRRIELMRSKPVILPLGASSSQHAGSAPEDAVQVESRNGQRSLVTVARNSTSPDRRDAGFPSARPRGSLQSVLGESLLDPFESSPVRNIPRRLLDALEFAWGAIWPTFHPDGQLNVTHPDICGWRKMSTQNPVLFHTHMSGAAGLALALQGDDELIRPLTMFRLSHANAAMELVSDQIRHLKGFSSDALIMAVLTLGAHAEELDENESGHSHPLSPLATVQNLHAFGRKALAHAHIKALKVLFHQKGGYSGIELRGLGALVYLNDILYATRFGGRPFTPNLVAHQSIVTSGKHVLDTEAIAMSGVLGTSFIIDNIYGIDNELYHTLHSACEATVALDHYHRRGALAPSILVLIEARNSVQHRLCSLEPRPLKNASFEDYIYEACRQAALVYSDMVLWPMPPGSGVKPRLVRKIREILEQPIVQHDWHLHGDLLLWIALMSGIASTFTPDRLFYVQQLRQHALSHAYTFVQFKNLMKLHLWWDHVIEEPAERLWLEAEKMALFVATEL